MDAGTVPAKGRGMIGFEIEISLLVTNQHGVALPGDSNLARCNPFALKLVSDRRQGHSNIEFVTDAVAVVGAGAAAAAGVARLIAQLGAIGNMRNALYAAQPGGFAAAIGPHATAIADGLTARIINFPPGYVPAENDGSDGLFLHYTLGVPRRALGAFFATVRAAAPNNPGSYLRRARFRASQAPNFAANLVAAYGAYAPGAPAANVNALSAYAELMYTQIAGVADYVDNVPPVGQVKNSTVALCRASFFQIYPGLPAGVRNFLAQEWANDTIIDRIALFQGVTETGGAANFSENIQRAPAGQVPYTLGQYVQSACTGAPQVRQTSMFGDMTLVAPAQENGVDQIVFEIRTRGAHYKTWAQVDADLRALAAWVQAN
jgi:hypothetical protein